MPEPLKIYVLKSDADAGNAEFQRKKKLADASNAPLIHVTDADVTLSRADARDRKKYEAAREAARGLGLTVKIMADGAPTQVATGLADRTFLKTEDTIYLIREASLNRATFLKLEAEAKREFKTLKPIRAWGDLPEAERDALEASLKDA